MGSVKIDCEHDSLLNSANYQSVKALKRLYKNYDNLFKLACLGNRAAVAIYLDLKNALESEELTALQVTYITQHLIEKTKLEDIAADNDCSSENVFNIVQSGVFKIRRILRTGTLYFAEDEAEKFLQQHDGLYKRKNRMHTMEYPYLTKQQEKARHKKEIPESSLSIQQRIKINGEEG